MDQIAYSQKRQDILDGDIILFRGKTVLSRMIRLLTRSPYSHAGIVAWWEDRLMVLEARGAGVVASRLSHVVEDYDGAAELWTANDDEIEKKGKTLDRQKIIANARLHLGKQYAKWKLFAGLRKLLFGTDEHADPQKPPKKFVCSEYVSLVWKAGGVDLSEELDRYTAPKHIALSGYIRPVGRLSPTPRNEEGTSIPEDQVVHVVTT